MRPILLALVLCAACGDKPATGDTDAIDDTGGAGVDRDGDGWVAAEDCDDEDAETSPDAEEICDGLDNDCDGLIDDDDPVVEGWSTSAWTLDEDGDGFGTEASWTWACDAPGSGWVVVDEDGTLDCDDGDASVYPGADETCDRDDEDCDYAIDEGAIDAVTWYPDDDRDGFGEDDRAETSCSAPGSAAVEGGDCDDGDADVNPGETEVCNTIDDDCDGLIDDDDPSLDAEAVWAPDGDGDGYGAGEPAVAACVAPSGYGSGQADCDDTDAAVNPAAAESCNTLDDDCDGLIDDDDPSVEPLTWYADVDGDGYGATGVAAESCVAPSGYVAADGDCDEADAAVNPGATEDCENGIDDDCDGVLDIPWYPDADGDGYGATGVAVAACTAPSGYVADDGDCDDAEPSVNPGASEVCGDGVDNDCDDAAPGCGPYGAMDLDDADAIFSGVDISRFGGPIAAGGDVDGDGYSDLLFITRPSNDAYLYLGGALSGALDSAGADTTFSPSYGPDAAAIRGDMNGDGYDDVILGAPSARPTGIHGAGEVYLFLGPVSGTLDESSAEALLYGPSDEDLAGGAMSFAGDVNGDGYDDALIGYSSGLGEDTGMEEAYLVYGPVSGEQNLDSAGHRLYGGERLGGSVGGGGDVDGDGLDDLLIGDYRDDDGGSYAGAAYLVSGPVSGDLLVSSGATAKLTGASEGARVSQFYGTSDCLRIGDGDGDGYSDLLIGAQGDAAVYLVHGPVTGDVSLSDADATLSSSAAIGRSCNFAGDVDGDGEADLLVAAGEDGVAPNAWLLRGAVSGNVALDTATSGLIPFAGGGCEYVFGCSAVGAGDVDGDGYDDVLISDQDAGDAGVGWLFYGGPGL